MNNALTGDQQSSLLGEKKIKYCTHAQKNKKQMNITLTFDCMQNSVVQWLAARVVGRRADACSTTVRQSVPGTSQQESVSTEQRETKILVTYALMPADENAVNFCIESKSRWQK